MKRYLILGLILSACLTSCISSKPREMAFELLPADFVPMYNELKDTLFVTNSQAEFDTVASGLQLQFQQNEMDLSSYFNTHTLLLVYGGWQRTTGYALDTKKLVKKGKNIQVEATLSTPGEGCLMADMITFPMQLVAIPKQKKVRYSLVLQKVSKNCR